MSRDIGTLNAAEVVKSSLEPVLLVKFEFDTPVYVHTNVGTITFESNVYTGVGELGEIQGAEESEQLSPSPLRLTLSGLTPEYIVEALDAGDYGDIVTIYKGYINSDGVLVESPWVYWRGTFEHANIELGDDRNAVTVVVQNDLKVLTEKSGRRWSDEDQQREYPGDTFFSFIHGIANQKLTVGGQPVAPRPSGPGGNPGEPTVDD